MSRTQKEKLFRPIKIKLIGKKLYKPSKTDKIISKYLETINKYKKLQQEKQNASDYIEKERFALNPVPLIKKKKKIKKNQKIEYKGKQPITYERFLKTKYWKHVKEIILDRDNYKCIRCGNINNLHVHHTTYKNHYNEHKHLSDLITLCSDCHKKEHNKKDV